MIPAVATFLYLHLIALHCSIALMEMFSSVLLLGALVLVTTGRVKFRLRSQDRLLIAGLLAFAAWVALSLVMNPLVKPFLFQFGFMRWIAVLIALLVCFEAVWQANFERRLIRIWVGCVVIAGLYATFQCLTGIDFFHKDAVSSQGGGIWKAAGFFSISLTFAYCYGILTFAIFKPAFNWDRRAGLAVVIIGTLGILSSMSRGAWLGGLACVFIYLLAKHRRLILPAVGAVVVIAGLLVLQGGGFARKISEMVQLHMDHSSSMRVDLWRAYWQMFLEHPVFGVGLFSGDKYLPEYYAKLGIVQPFVSHAHNNLLNFLAGTGVPGFLFYVVICGYFMRLAWRLRNEVAWGWSLFLAQVFVQLGGLTECNFIDGEVTHGLIFVWAMTWMLDRARTARDTPAATRTKF